MLLVIEVDLHTYCSRLDMQDMSMVKIGTINLAAVLTQLSSMDTLANLRPDVGIHSS